MMKCFHVLLPPLALLALTVFAVAKPIQASPPVQGTQEISLDPAAQARLGIRTQPATAIQVPREIAALGQVLNPQTWLSSIAELRAAEARAETSAEEAQRLQRLYGASHNTSLKALQAAQTQASADRLQRDLLRQRLRLDWGAGLAGLKPAQQARLSARLVHGETVLVRADAPRANPGDAFAAASLQALDGGPAIPAQIIGRAPTVAPTLQAPAWLLRVDGAGADALRPGQALQVWLQSPGSIEAAIQIPEAAIVRIDGQPFAFVRTAADEFRSYALTLLAPRGDGWAASTAIEAGAALVVGGADALWWAQQAPPSAGGNGGQMQGDGDSD